MDEKAFVVVMKSGESMKKNKVLKRGTVFAILVAVFLTPGCGRNNQNANNPIVPGYGGYGPYGQGPYGQNGNCSQIPFTVQGGTFTGTQVAGGPVPGVGNYGQSVIGGTGAATGNGYTMQRSNATSQVTLYVTPTGGSTAYISGLLNTSLFANYNMGGMNGGFNGGFGNPYAAMCPTQIGFVSNASNQGNGNYTLWNAWFYLYMNGGSPTLIKF